MGCVSFFHFVHKNKPLKLPSFEEAQRQLKKGGFIWLDFFQPTAELLSILSQLNVHPLSIEDCLDEDQIPKMDIFPETTFVLANSFEYFDEKLTIGEVDFILGKDFLVTVHGQRSDSQRFFAGLPALIERHLVEVSRGPDFLMHVILDYIVDEKFKAIEIIQEKINQFEENVLGGAEKFRPEDLLKLRGDLLVLRKSLFHEREVFIKICRKDSPLISEKAIYFFRDIYDHLAKFFELIEISREMIANLFELFISVRSNQLALLSQQTNEVMKRLTLITTIFMPLTLISGIGGMSEFSMICGPENWKISYPLFFLAMGLIAYANYWLLKFFKWV